MEEILKDSNEIVPEKRKEKKKSGGRGWLVFKIIMFVIFLLYAISLIYPVFYGFLTSLKSQSENELSADGSNMFNMFFNSIWYTLGGTILGVFVSMMTAYVAAKYEFPGRKLVYGVAMFVMMIPIVGAMPSQYRMYTVLGIIDSPLLVITFASGLGFNFIVLYSFYKSLSWEYAEAAFIDGAGDFRVFIQVMVPQTLSIVLALCVVTSINFWNDYMGPLLFLRSYPTLATGIYRYRAITAIMNQNTPVYFSALIISMIPVLAVFVAFQNKMMDLSLGGGIKG